jgi:hypothetical protein
MPEIRGNFSQLMTRGLKRIYMDAYDTEQKSEEYPQIFKTETSDSQYEQVLEMTGFGPLQEKPENTPVAYNERIQGGSKRYIHLTYGLAVATSKELYEDDKYGIIRQTPKALARSVRFTKEMVAWNTFNLGFTSNVTTTDGVSLFNNAHPLLGGPGATNIAPGAANIISTPGTWPNRPATDLDLSVAAIQLGVTQFRRIPDNQGMPITLRPKMVWAPPELTYICREILGSAKKPYTSDNTINSLLADDLTFFTGSYLNSPSAWGLITDKKYHSLTFYTRRAPETTFDDDFNTDGIRQKVTMRISAGADVWQGVWGSDGP